MKTLWSTHINDHLVEIRASLPFREQQQQDAVKALLNADLVRFAFTDHGLPVIGWIWGRKEDAPQYFYGDVYVDGKSLYDQPYIGCSVYRGGNMHIPEHGVLQFYGNADLVEPDAGGRCVGRELAEITEGEDAHAVLDQLIETALNADHHSELAMRQARRAQFATLMQHVPATLTRAEYEAWCARLSTQVNPDPQSTYAARYYDYGVGGFDSLPIEQQIQIELDLRRGRALAAEEDAERARLAETYVSPQPAPWGSQGVRYDEECECCGRISEVDNSSGLCRRCRPEEYDYLAGGETARETAGEKS